MRWIQVKLTRCRQAHRILLTSNITQRTGVRLPRCRSHYAGAR